MFSAGPCRSSGYIETKDRAAISCNLARVSSSHRNGVTRLSFRSDRWTTRTDTLIACFAAVRALAHRDVWLGELRGAVARRSKCCPQGLGRPGVCPRGLSERTTSTERATTGGQTGPTVR
jgi:hypothetical protein